MFTREEFEEQIANSEELCKYCIYEDECGGMKSDGKGQPSYPPCADHSEEIIEDAYDRYVGEMEEKEL